LLSSDKWLTVAKNNITKHPQIASSPHHYFPSILTLKSAPNSAPRTSRRKSFQKFSANRPKSLKFKKLLKRKKPVNRKIPILDSDAGRVVLSDQSVK